MADPRYLAKAVRGSDPTASYNTQLSPQQEAAFQAWRAQQPTDLRNTGDYDLRGAWLGNAQEAGNGHLPDTWKKPNHMTFSDGSMYSTPAAPGGAWSQIAPATPQNPEGQWQFAATSQNLQAHTADDLLNYFQAVEANKRPDGTYGAPNRVVLPPGTK